MTQEDKELLLRDLCGRLPYGAKIHYKTAGWEDKNHTLSPQTIDNFLIRRDVVIISKGCFDYDSGMWHALEADCSYCKENVTNWMPLPEPPAKLSSVERTGKDWK